MIDDVDMILFKRYHDENKLKDVSLDFVFNEKKLKSSEEIFDTKKGKISINLKNLFRASTNFEKFSYGIEPDAIQSICLYGSVLYKNFPGQLSEVKPIFGRRFVLQERKIPKDLDFLVLLNKGLTKEDVIIPPKTRDGDRNNEKYLNFKNGLIKIEWDYGTSYIVKKGFSKIDVSSATGFDGETDERILNFHLCYRSVDQFLNGIGKGDFISEEAASYGIPIIGGENFERILKKHNFPNRNPLYNIRWSESLKGKLKGKLI